MHLKLYESSMMKVSSSLMKNNYTPAIPKSHPSYNKEPPKPKVTTTTKKRIETMKTTYNFLKNYH